MTPFRFDTPLPEFVANQIGDGDTTALDIAPPAAIDPETELDFCV